jgi:hypothetical protein
VTAAAAALTAIQVRRLGRRRWLAAVILAGVVLAATAAAAAAGEAALLREDALRRGAASLLLLGGLLLAIALGSSAFNRDADSGHLGLLLGAGASRPQLATAVLGARLGLLAAGLAAWGITLQLGSVTIGLGPDGPLAVHTLAVAEALALTLVACAAASTVVGPVPAGFFGAGVYVVAQAAVTMKAAADQGLIGTADALVSALYHLVPRTITSPMIAELQARDAAGPAAPQVEINENIVLVPAAGWGTVVWTLAWIAVLAAVCVAGMRRRPLG